MSSGGSSANPGKLQLGIAQFGVAAPGLSLLRRHILAAHAMMKPPLGELSIALVNQKKMCELHWRYLGDDSPTDVLTFEIEHDARGRVVAGEVIICVPVARRAARERGQSLANELLLYVLHGMLHLCGLDDRTPGGFAAMHAREDQLLTDLGVGPIFAARPTAPSTARPTARRRSHDKPDKRRPMPKRSR